MGSHLKVDNMLKKGLELSALLMFKTAILMILRQCTIHLIARMPINMP